MRKSDHANNLHITHSLEQATSVIGRNIEYTHPKNTVLTIKIIIRKMKNMIGILYTEMGKVTRVKNQVRTWKCGEKKIKD